MNKKEVTAACGKGAMDVLHAMRGDHEKKKNTVKILVASTHFRVFPSSAQSFFHEGLICSKHGIYV